MRTYIRIVLAAALLLPGCGRASAAIVASASASRGVSIAPIPLGAMRQRLGNPGLRGALGLKTGLSSVLFRPGVLPSITLRPVLRTVAGVTPAAAALGPTQVMASKKAAQLSVKRSLPAPAGTVARTAGKRVTIKAPVRKRLAQAERGLKSSIKKSGFATAYSALGSFFDGLGKFAFKSFVSGRDELRPPDWWEDRRMTEAWGKLGESKIGLDLYEYVYGRYGDDLNIVIDTERGVDYDARLSWHRNVPTIQFAENLVDGQSAEVVASYLARELTEIYLKDFPESTDRNYMAFSNMVRTYAEITDSGRRHYRDWWKEDYWWNTDKDYWNGEGHVMQGTYLTYKAAVEDLRYNGSSVRSSTFFQWLKDSGGANKGGDSRLTLRQLYRRGRISYRKFQELDDYFKDFTGSETAWFDATDRW